MLFFKQYSSGSFKTQSSEAVESFHSFHTHLNSLCNLKLGVCSPYLRRLVVVRLPAGPEDEHRSHHEHCGDGEGERVRVVDTEVGSCDGGEEGADVDGEVVEGEELALHAILQRPVGERELDLVASERRSAGLDSARAEGDQTQGGGGGPEERVARAGIRRRECRERHHPIPQAVDQG